MTFGKIINDEFDPEDIKQAIKLNGCVGEFCEWYCDKSLLCNGCYGNLSSEE